MEQNRVPRGVNGGGRFASTAGRQRAPVELSPGSPHPGEPLPSQEAILTAQGLQLWEYVRHPDPTVREGCAANPYLTEDQRAYLADPSTQPFSVRCAIARLPNPGVAARACSDPDPVVRWLASVNGWDLTAAEREILDSDSAVVHVGKVMANQLEPSL
jgi:hypothetical protein